MEIKGCAWIVAKPDRTRFSGLLPNSRFYSHLPGTLINKRFGVRHSRKPLASTLRDSEAAGAETMLAREGEFAKDMPWKWRETPRPA
jgi:hypothetical protein